MQAVGFIETKGLIAAIEAADAMLKAANVGLVDRVFVKGGLVTIIIEGDVGAVKAATDAGAAAATRVGKVISIHVIPRPHEEVSRMIARESEVPADRADADWIEVDGEDRGTTEIIEEISAQDVLNEEIETEQSEVPSVEDVQKEALDYFAEKGELNQILNVLKNLKVTKLRALAREYSDFGITGRAISNADKNLLMDEFKKYYQIHL